MTAFSRRSRVPAHRRCEALLSDSYMRPTNDRCGRFASVAIAGRELCGKHASMLALQVALKRGTAKELPQAPWPPRRGLRIKGQDEV